MRKLLIVMLFIGTAGCRPDTKPQSYVDTAKDTQHCADADRGDGWIKSRSSNDLKLQAGLACAAYWRGRWDAEEEALDDLLKGAIGPTDEENKSLRVPRA